MGERIVEALRDGEIVRVSEREARSDELFILRSVEELVEHPNLVQKSMPAPPPSLRSMEQKKEKRYTTPMTPNIETWKNKFVDYKKNNVAKELVQNFQWEVVKARKAKNLSRRQLAVAIGTSEEEIKVIEFGNLPRDDFVLVTKLENYLGISLRKSKKSDVSNLPVFGEKEGSNKSVAGSDIELIE